NLPPPPAHASQVLSGLLLPVFETDVSMAKRLMTHGESRSPAVLPSNRLFLPAAPSAHAEFALSAGSGLGLSSGSGFGSGSGSGSGSRPNGRELRVVLMLDPIHLDLGSGRLGMALTRLSPSLHFTSPSLS